MRVTRTRSTIVRHLEYNILFSQSERRNKAPHAQCDELQNHREKLQSAERVPESAAFPPGDVRAKPHIVARHVVVVGDDSEDDGPREVGRYEEQRVEQDRGEGGDADVGDGQGDGDYEVQSRKAGLRDKFHINIESSYSARCKENRYGR